MPKSVADEALEFLREASEAHAEAARYMRETAIIHQQLERSLQTASNAVNTLLAAASATQAALADTVDINIKAAAASGRALESAEKANDDVRRAIRALSQDAEGE